MRLRIVWKGFADASGKRVVLGVKGEGREARVTGGCDGEGRDTQVWLRGSKLVRRVELVRRRGARVARWREWGHNRRVYTGEIVLRTWNLWISQRNRSPSTPNGAASSPSIRRWISPRAMICRGLHAGRRRALQGHRRESRGGSRLHAEGEHGGLPSPDGSAASGLGNIGPGGRHAGCGGQRVPPSGGASAAWTRSPSA